MLKLMINYWICSIVSCKSRILQKIVLETYLDSRQPILNGERFPLLVICVICIWKTILCILRNSYSGNGIDTSWTLSSFPALMSALLMCSNGFLVDWLRMEKMNRQLWGIYAMVHGLASNRTATFWFTKVTEAVYFMNVWFFYSCSAPWKVQDIKIKIRYQPQVTMFPKFTVQH